MLDQAGKSDVLRLALRQLDPVIEQTVSDPEYICVNTFTTGLNLFIFVLFLNMSEGTLNDPVVLHATKDFTYETKACRSTHLCKVLKSLRKSIGEFITEGDSCPLEHLRLFFQIWHTGVQWSGTVHIVIYLRNVWIISKTYFIDEVFALGEPKVAGDLFGVIH